MTTNKEALEALEQLNQYALARMDNKQGVWKKLVETIRAALQADTAPVDVEALKTECARELAYAIPHSFSDNTMLNTFDFLQKRGLIRGCEWQPIETAPAGCWIIIHAYDCVMQACWNANGYWSTYENGRVQPEAATHWQPLPEPPKGQNDERD